MNIYQAPIVTAIQRFYGPLLSAFNRYPTLKGHLSAIAQRLWEGVQAKEDCVFAQLNNYNPKFIGQKVEALKEAEITEADCQATIAFEYGYKDWSAIPDENYDENFQQALFALLFGSHQELAHFLNKYPALATQRSQHGHQATLLHYLGSNGVPFWQQQVPLNAPAIAKLLLEKGADKNATMNVYGGQFDVLSLLKTSAHPKAAGIAKEMEAVFQ